MIRHVPVSVCAACLVLALAGPQKAQAQARAPMGWFSLRASVSAPDGVAPLRPAELTLRRHAALGFQAHLRERLPGDAPSIVGALSSLETLPVRFARTSPLDRFGPGRAALERLSPELREASLRYQIGVRIAI